MKTVIRCCGVDHVGGVAPVLGTVEGGSVMATWGYLCDQCASAAHSVYVKYDKAIHFSQATRRINHPK